MPGIYTHNYIFRKCLDSINKNSYKSYIYKSIETLFAYSEHRKAGLFGSIGPNIFDYMAIKRNNNLYADEITFYLHDTGCVSFIHKMSDKLLNNSDHRNEWFSIQRAYLLGYISHIIADSILHPFVYYSSGFPEKDEISHIINCRKANLRFQYNIDNYLLYRDEYSSNIVNVDEILPDVAKSAKNYLWSSIKVFILDSLKKENPDLFTKKFKGINEKEIDGNLGIVKKFDIIPRNIMLCYKLKRTVNERLIKIIDKLGSNPVTYSDFFVRYPAPKRVDEDAMNIHQGRWQYPAMQRGFRYESALHLIKFSIERTVEVWEYIETMIQDNKKIDICDILYLNAYTGEKGVYFNEMKIKDIIKLRV